MPILKVLNTTCSNDFVKTKTSKGRLEGSGVGLKGTVKLVNLEDLELKGTRPGLKGTTLFGEDTPTRFIRSGIFTLEPGAELDLHYHDVEELQHVIHGYGALTDSERKEHKLSPGTTFYCPPGPEGAHGIKNTSDLTFVCLYMYYSPGGKNIPVIRLGEK